MNSLKSVLPIAVIIFAALSSTAAATTADSAKAFLSTKVDSSQISAARSSTLPKLIDLGSKGCIPCKRMAPILDSLREEYKGRAEVVFIDVREDRAAAARHKITIIPTQIFFDTTGIETYRHIGFFPADSIVTHLRALGVEP